MPSALSDKKYAEMSLEELDVRGAELRADLCDLPEGTRSAETDSRMAHLLDEVKRLDAHYTLARHKTREQERAALRDILAPAGATGAHGQRGWASIGERIANSEAFQNWLSHGMRNSDGGVNLALELNGFLDPTRRNIITSEGAGVRTVTEFGAGGPGNAATGNVNTLLPVGQPIAPIPRQARLAMRDLIPSQPTTLPTVPYVRELTPTANELGASAVAEGNTKPDSSVTFTGVSAPITVIATSLSPSKQLWEDAPLVVAYINQRLPYLARFKEDAEIIAGNGTWPNIEGIKTASGLQTQAVVNTSDKAQTIGMAIAKVEDVDGSATGCVLYPDDAWTMFTQRASTSGIFDAGTPFSMSALDSLTVWGLPTVRSRAYPAGSALVGDFAHGAMILDREGINVQIFPQHSDYAARNQVLVLCEERVGLANWRPDLFVQANFS